MDELLKRLKRYSKECITERLDSNFAEAVEMAIAILAIDEKIIITQNDLLRLSEEELNIYRRTE